MKKYNFLFLNLQYNLSHCQSFISTDLVMDLWFWNFDDWGENAIHMDEDWYWYEPDLGI